VNNSIATFLNGRVIVLVGDITQQQVDAIVNAANATLLGGGGVDGAIHRAGGPAILDECREIRRTRFPQGLPTGEAVITTGGNLPAHHVIHTVGPIYGRHAGREAELLSGCYVNSLQLAAQHGLKSIAFPAISTGAFGYPPHEAAAVSSQAIQRWLSSEEAVEPYSPGTVGEGLGKTLEVRLIFFLARDAQSFLKHQTFS
jgi:O-acetyl-ADP-ribose deacetylase